LIINKRREDHNRFGFVLQLSTVHFLGAFLDATTNEPKRIVVFVANQIGDIDVNCLQNYMGRKPTVELIHRLFLVRLVKALSLF
jgi:hypothetical protein